MKKMLSILRNIPAEFGEMLDKMEKFEGETIFEYDCATSRIWIYGAASELFEGHEQTIADFVGDPRLAGIIDPEDIEGLQDLIIAAANQALKQIDETNQERINAITGGMKMPF